MGYICNDTGNFVMLYMNACMKLNVFNSVMGVIQILINLLILYNIVLPLDSRKWLRQVFYVIRPYDLYNYNPTLTSNTF